MSFFAKMLVLAMLLLCISVNVHAQIHTRGFVTDLKCWGLTDHIAIDGAVLDTNPEDHTVGCLLMESCIASGFGLLVIDETGMYDMAFEFDADSNLLIVTFLEELDTSGVVDTVYVHVETTDNGDGTHSLSEIVLSTNWTPPTIMTVEGSATDYVFDPAGEAMITSLTSSSPVAQDEVIVQATGYYVDGYMTVQNVAIYIFEWEGFIVDQMCWDEPDHIGIDGAQLDTHPEHHTRECLLLCYDSGYGLVSDDNDDGVYDWAITFDQYGTDLGYNLTYTNTELTVYLMIRVSGWWDGGESLAVTDMKQLTYIEDYYWQISLDYYLANNYYTSGSEMEDLLRFDTEWDGMDRVIGWQYGIDFTVVLIVPSFDGEHYVVDNLCWEADGHVGIDGAKLDTEPELHTKECMLLDDCYASGYLLLEQNIDGTYSPAYTLDSYSSSGVWGHLVQTAISGDVYDNLLMYFVLLPTLESTVKGEVSPIAVEVIHNSWRDRPGNIATPPEETGNDDSGAYSANSNTITLLTGLFSAWLCFY